MKSKLLFWLLITVLLITAPPVEAQQPKKIARIGWLSPAVESATTHLLDAFREGLHAHGYVEGQQIIIEQRWAKGRTERLPELANELVRLNVDVIVTAGPGIRAAKNATKTIPIVISSTTDPIKAGYVASLARPGGNITGVTAISSELVGKRLELLKEILPKLSRVAALWDPSDTSGSQEWKEMQTVGPALGLQIQSLEVRDQKDFEKALGAAANERVDALLPLTGPAVVNNRARLISLAAKQRLPAIYPWREFVEEGGLMSYTERATDRYQRLAYYVDKILKGAKPADLPVEQPKKFELVINLKAAKQIGLTMPPNVLARADRVIR